jgi:ribosomal protein S18 acetylase RimI-like enzyme
MEVRLRPATDDDKEFARRIHHDAFRAVVLRQFGRFGDEQDGFFDVDWDSGELKHILEIDGEDAGYVHIVDDADAVKVKQIVIGPKHQGRGAGTYVMRDAIELARSEGKPVWLGVLHQNHAARRLYERLGFRETGTTDTHVLMEWRRDA